MITDQTIFTADNPMLSADLQTLVKGVNVCL